MQDGWVTECLITRMGHSAFIETESGERFFPTKLMDSPFSLCSHVSRELPTIDMPRLQMIDTKSETSIENKLTAIARCERKHFQTQKVFKREKSYLTPTLHSKKTKLTNVEFLICRLHNWFEQKRAQQPPELCV